MPDTLIDPPPPTVDDAELLKANAPEAEPSAEKPKKKRPLLIAVIGLIFALLIGSAFALYFFFVRYEPVALHHVPGNANLVMRVSASDIFVFGPVRKHLWPLLFEQAFSSSGKSKSGTKSRAETIKDATGFNVATDLREVVVATVDGTGWVLLLGGKMPRGGFVDGIEKLSRDEGWVGWRRDGDFLVGPGAPTPVVIGQADDTTIVLGSDTDIVKAAIPSTEEWHRMGLPTEGALTFAVSDTAWNGAAHTLGRLIPGGLSLGGIQRVTGRVLLQKETEISVFLEPLAGQDPETIRANAESVLVAGRMAMLLLPQDKYGEKQALSSASATVEGAKVKIRVLWPYDGLDRACERIAASLRSKP